MVCVPLSVLALRSCIYSVPASPPYPHTAPGTIGMLAEETPPQSVTPVGLERGSLWPPKTISLTVSVLQRSQILPSFSTFT